MSTTRALFGLGLVTRRGLGYAAGRRALRLAPYGVRTCLDLAMLGRSTVRSVLTFAGEKLWAELNGESCIGIETARVPYKTIGRGGGISPTMDAGFVSAWAVRNLERLIEELDFHDVRAGKLTVWVSYKGGPLGLGEAHFDAVTDRFDELLDGLRAGLRQAWRANVPAGRGPTAPTRSPG